MKNQMFASIRALLAMFEAGKIGPATLAVLLDERASAVEG